MVHQTGHAGWVNAVAHELGPGVTIVSRPGEFIISLPCTICHDTKEYTIGRKFPPVVVRRNLERMGWRTGRHLACKSCVNTRPNANKKSQFLSGAADVSAAVPSPKPAPTPAPVPAPAPTVPVKQPTMPQVEPEVARGRVKGLEGLGQLLPEAAAQGAVEAARPQGVEVEVVKKRVVKVPPKQPPAPKEETPVNVEAPATSQAAKRAHRDMMMLLEAHFDEEKGRYRSDKTGVWTDERVATTSGASVAHVKKEREHWFGKLQEPEELTEVRAKLAGLEAAITSMGEAAKDKIRELERQLGAATAALEQEHKAALHTLERLQRSYG